MPRDLTDYDTDGTNLGQDASDKVGLWGVTPVVQPSGAAQAALTDSTGGTTDGTVGPVADIALSTSNTYTDAAVNTAVNAAIAEINNDLSELATLANAIQAALVAAGVMKGSA